MKDAKTLGKFKDKMKGIPVKEFVALHPKMYSIQLKQDMMIKHHNLKKAAAGKIETLFEISKRKSLPKRLPKEQERLFFAHKKYKDIYFGGPSQKVVFPTFNHTKTLSLYTGIQTKAGLAALNYKSYWFRHASCIHYGHYYIQEFEEMQSKEKIMHAPANSFAPAKEFIRLEHMQEEVRSAVSDTELSPSEAKNATHNEMDVSFGEDDPMILIEEEDDVGSIVDMWEMKRRYRLRYSDHVMVSVSEDGDYLVTFLKLALNWEEDVTELCSYIQQALKMDLRLECVHQRLLEIGIFEKILRDVQTPHTWLGEEFLWTMLVLFLVVVHVETLSGLRIMGDENAKHIVLLTYNTHYSLLLPL